MGDEEESMMIWKYLVYQNKFSHMMPRGTKFLSVQPQHEDIQMWFMMDPGFQVHSEESMELRVFRVVATGEEFKGNLEYLGTFQIGRFVYHLFENIREK